MMSSKSFTFASGFRKFRDPVSYDMLYHVSVSSIARHCRGVDCGGSDHGTRSSRRPCGGGLFLKLHGFEATKM